MPSLLHHVSRTRQGRKGNLVLNELKEEIEKHRKEIVEIVGVLVFDAFWFSDPVCTAAGDRALPYRRSQIFIEMLKMSGASPTERVFVTRMPKGPGIRSSSFQC